MSQIHGAIFDWDGVIIDSHDAHARAWERLAAEIGKPIPDGFFKTTFGMRNDRIIPGYSGWAEPHETEKVRELGLRKEAHYREVIREEGITPLPGVITLLQALREAGIPCVVGSSTERANIALIMEMGGLTEYFADVAASEDVVNGKPAPDVFLKAAEKILRKPENCVVFEDAHVGIQAALAAGCRAVAVCTTHPAESFAASGACRIIQSLAEITPAELWPGA